MPDSSRINSGLSLSGRAAEVLHDLCEREAQSTYGVRLSLEAGGCSGLCYHLSLESHPAPDDRIFHSHGITIFCDPYSLQKVAGSSIDWSDKKITGGFVVHNPNAVHSCGCGSSFFPG